MAARLGLDRSGKRFLKSRYTPGQRKVLRHISAEARRRYRAPGSEKGRKISQAERRKIQSAYMTGKVESNFRNLNYGHADSKGWRQERQMYYPDPTNLPASVRRYFEEADRAYSGQSKGALAQAVQRSAFPSRYAEHEGEARSLYQQLVKGSAGDARRGAGGGGSRSREPQGTPQSLRALISGGPQRTPVSGSAPQEPAFSGRSALKMPELGGDVPGSGVPGPPDRSSSDLARLLSSIPQTPPVPAPTRGPGGFVDLPGSEREGNLIGSWMRGGKLYRFDPKKGKWVRPGSGRTPAQQERASQRGGQLFDAPMGKVIGAPIDRAGVRTKPIVRRFTKRLAGSLGRPIRFGTGTAHSQMTSSGNVSEHWGGRAIDLPAAGRGLTEMGAHALRLVGVPRKNARSMARSGGIYNISHKGRRFQIIVNTTDHYDHLHVGISP